MDLRPKPDIILGVTPASSVIPRFEDPQIPGFAGTTLRSGLVGIMSSPTFLDLSLLVLINTIPTMPEIPLVNA
jgi:hypothetical protein